MTIVQNRTVRGSVAVSPEKYRAQLISMLFKRYSDDKLFRSDLLSFAERQRVNEDAIMEREGDTFEAVSRTDSRLAPYSKDVRTFAESWGLDRVDGYVGLEAIHRWLWLRFKSEGPLKYHEDGSSFGFGVSLESDVAFVDLMVIGDLEWNPELEPRFDSEIKIPRKRRKAVLKPIRTKRDLDTGQDERITGARRYYWTGARTRILSIVGNEHAEYVDSQLDRIQAEYQSLGWVWPTSKGRQQRDIDWVFLRLANKESSEDIARDLGATQKYVRQRTDKMARELGIPKFPRANQSKHTAHRF